MTSNNDREFDNEAPANDPLRDDLRRQAMAERPPFSDELHERIMQRVRSEASQESPHPASPPSTGERSLGPRELDPASLNPGERSDAFRSYPSPLYSGERQGEGILGAPKSYPIRRWRLPTTIAATLLLAATITAAWLMRPQTAKPLPAPLVMQDPQPESTQVAQTEGDSPLNIKGAVPFNSNRVDLPIRPAPALARFTSDFSGLFSQTHQPKLTLKLPIVGDVPSPARPEQSPPLASANSASPQSLLSALKSPARGTQSVVEQVIPPEMKMLVAMARAQTP